MRTKQTLKGLLLIFAFLLASCGKDNVSGNNPNANVFGGAIGIPTQYGNALYSENPCRVNTQPTYGYPGQYGYPQQQAVQGRQTIITRLQGINVAVGSSYVGVTSEGDIANVYNDGSGPVMAMQICGIPAGAQAQVSSLVINNSLNCAVDEISSSNVLIINQYGQPLYLTFRPIYGSSLCGNGYQY